MEVLEDCKCDALTMKLGFRTQGKGDVDEHWLPTQTLAFGQSWKAGEVRSCPFEFTAANGPLSYDGEIVSLRWFLSARADLAWAIDAKLESEVFLVPAPPPEPRDETEPASVRGYREPARRVVPPRSPSPAVPRTRIFPHALAVLAFGAAGWGWSLFHSVAYESVALAFGVAASAFALRRTWTESRVGRPEVTVEPATLRPGETLLVRVVLAPRRSSRLLRAWAEVTAEERAEDTRGDGSTTHSRNVLRERIELAPRGGATLEPGERRTFERELRLPPNAPVSFKTSHNELRWSAVLGVDVEGVPDWTEEYDLTVV